MRSTGGSAHAIMSLSEKLHSEAARLIPGGVNSPVRAWKNVGGTPRFIVRAAGATVTDADGTTYRDFVGSWGAAVAGHAHPKVVHAVQRAAAAGLGYGAPTTAEIELARAVVESLPGVEKVRMVSSGTEAVMSAIRVARAFTGRPKILKFAGCYHGHSDGLLARAGSGAMTFGLPDSAGVPEAITSHTLVAAYNDLAQVEADNRITLAVAQEGLKRAGVDARGLTRVDRVLLLALSRAGGMPLGLKSLCAAVGEDERTLEDVYEPHLLREGYVVKTPQGRRLTPRGHALMDPAAARLGRDGQGTLPL